MTKILSRVFALALLGLLPAAQAHAADPTVISRVSIEYSRLLNGSGDRMAAVGGKVDFSGPGPVFTTLTIGGQSYSAPTDPSGRFSYLIWANDSRFEVSAWTSPADPHAAAPGTPSMKTEASLPASPK